MKFQVPYKPGVGIQANQEICIFCFYLIYTQNLAKIVFQQKGLQKIIKSHSRIQGQEQDSVMPLAGGQGGL